MTKAQWQARREAKFAAKERAAIDAARVIACIACDYDLNGLPKNHRCPECGQAYEENTYRFRALGSVRFRRLIPLMFVTFVIAVAVLFIINSRINLIAFTTWRVIFLAAFRQFTICLGVILSAQWWNSRRYILFSPRGVEWRSIFQKKRQVEWWQVDDVRVNEANGEIELRPIASSPVKIPSDAWGGTMRFASIAGFTSDYWSKISETIQNDQRRLELLRLRSLETEPILQNFWKPPP
ncbi:MAG: hypothetical protein IPK83_01605 [Planctomycetes bacterium]|nr:hypothetical protein [Planctomycetota bacterium]